MHMHGMQSSECCSRKTYLKAAMTNDGTVSTVVYKYGGNYIHDGYKKKATVPYCIRKLSVHTHKQKLADSVL